MAWEQRSGCSIRYYCQTRRQGRQFARTYVGTGELADVIAATDALARQEQVAALQLWQAFLQQWDGAATASVRFATASALLLRMTLVATGYYQHDRGSWRRRHETRKS